MSQFIPRRLLKYVKDSTKLSVAEIVEAWERARITVISPAPGPAMSQGLLTLVFEEDTVLLDGQKVTPKERHFAAVLNKPKGTLSVVSDKRGKRDLSPWLQQMPPGTFPVGRLDRDTTGVLLFTTDGDLSSAVLRPEHHTDKLYWLWLNEEFEADDSRLAKLTCNADQRYHAAKRASIVHRVPDYVEVHLTLDQGKNRQIRRMCRALDLRLLHLHRKRIGPVSDAGLAVGEFRALSEQELEALWQATGGRHATAQRKLRALHDRAVKLAQEGIRHHRLERWLEQYGAN